MREAYKTYRTKDEASAAALRLCDLELRARVEADGLTVTYDANHLEDETFAGGRARVGLAVQKARELGV